MRWAILLAVSAFNLYAATLLNGAGATFPYPLYSKWFSTFHSKNSEVQINYQSIGSGGGIRQFTEKTVDFGATDVPMTDEQLAKTGATKEEIAAGKTPVLHIPTALGAVVVTYHLKEVPSGLKLSAKVIADIFMGKITKWEDERIVSLNLSHTAKLKGDILPVHRSDGSGTTAVFTGFLGGRVAEFKTVVGVGTSVGWSAGVGGKGNEGVTGVVKQTPGSVGYVEFIYAKNNGLSFASIDNKEGIFVEPSLESVTAAAGTRQIPIDFRILLSDPSGKKSYPLSSYTYLLVWRKMPDSVKAKAMQSFLKWALKEGQSLVKELHYSPLPVDVATAVLKSFEEQRKTDASR